MAGGGPENKIPLCSVGKGAAEDVQLLLCAAAAASADLQTVL